MDIVEWDRWCCDTLRENRARGAEVIRHWPEPREGDVRKFSFTQFEGKVELVTGGPPCQPFSLGGRHRAELDHRDMWPQAVRAVRETRPSAFIFENVKGLTRATFQTYFSYVYLQLGYPEIVACAAEDWTDHRVRLEQCHSSGVETGLSYRVLPPQVLNAANHGVPQKARAGIASGAPCRLSALIAATGDVALQHLTLMIDSAPQVDHLTVQLHVHLVQVPAPMPKPTHSADLLAADVTGEQRAEAIPPQPHRLVADVNAALEQQVLGIRSDSGKRAYMRTTNRIAPGEELK